jgi:hypothetical protein
MTSRTFLSVAPIDSSIPMARSRRCASTVNPPTDTSAMRSMPRVASVSTIVSGLSAFPWDDEPGVEKLGPRESAGTPASKSTVTSVGDLTCPGTTSANSSSRLWGFWTMPTTVRVVPSWSQVSPTLRFRVEASPGVTATWLGPDG